MENDVHSPCETCMFNWSVVAKIGEMLLYPIRRQQSELLDSGMVA